MAGIYIHVPFCKTRCAYCDFFTKTEQILKTPYVEAVSQEIKLRSGYTGNEAIDTIYFGGGTPSQLSIQEIRFILDSISDNFVINNNPEITLEANPDDLDEAYTDNLIAVGINRLSIGIQSFDDKHLHFLNRRHSSRKAIDTVKSVQNAGLKNISIDLMYGLPAMTENVWENTLDTAIQLGVQHISAYHLIYEEGTPLFRLLDKGKIKPVNEDLSVEMFSTMIDKLTGSGFIHYEISNFGKENFFSRHNTSYWLDTCYLGLGPAAHSFNHISRSWNVSSISRYIEGIKTGNAAIECETLTPEDKYNDYILTRMRTMWGINITELEEKFGENMLQYFLVNIKSHLSSGNIISNGENYRFSKKGIFISDSIMSDLMYIG